MLDSEKETTDQGIREEITRKVRTLKEEAPKRGWGAETVEVTDSRVREIFREVTASELEVDWESPTRLPPRPVAHALYEGNTEEITETRYETSVPGLRVSHIISRPIAEGYRPREVFSIHYKKPRSK